MNRIENEIERILHREGGFVNRALDRGGPTNWGITIGTLSEVRGTKATVEDVRELSRVQAADIYRVRYITVPKFDLIKDDKLFGFVVDTAVNNGRDRASRWLQRAVGALEDGIIGPKTITAANKDGMGHIYFNRLVGLRIKAYGALISGNHSQAIFAAGWLNRVAEFLL